MSLLDFLKPLSGADRAGLAARCGTSIDYLFLIAYGHRKPKAALAISIERESGGKVRCEELLPDADWAYIRASGGASQLEVPVAG
jgi:DNA-binding transcriptional regulator YdaS (Cro superfamily)